MSESKIKNADNLIAQEEAIKLGRPVPEIIEKEKEEEKEAPKDEGESEENLEGDTEEHEEEKEEEVEEPEEKEEVEQESKADDSTDEYGTKVDKKKLYTKEEVQKMIRDRLSRVKNVQQNQDLQQSTKDFTPDPESGESWETQLEGFIENTIAKREQKAKELEWKAREEQNHAQFEEKFTNSMTKYKDFEQVVSNKPITNAMMIATRDMNDPAAFIYAACKQHPKEIERIAQIQDPISQGVEIGRLEERMKKARNLPASPKPAKQISGDKSSDLPQIGIDARIAQHAKSKIMERRK